MNRKSFVLTSLMFILLPAILSGQENATANPIKPGAKVEKLAGGFSFTEGPAADRKGNVYFTDQPNDRIMVWTTKGKLQTFMQPCGRSNGMYFDPAGNLWTCADEKNELWKTDIAKNVTIVLEKFRDSPFNGPNDLWISPTGGVYFTDPYYQRSWWSHSVMQQDRQCVYFLKAENAIPVRVAEDLVKPNGIVGSSDGKILYVADIGGNKTWSYTINEDGTLSNKKLFCEMGSDGITLDKQGNLYLTGKGVTIFSREGIKIINIPVPEKWTANVCFGDRDGKSLFITASTGLYRVRMQVKGADR
jgi:gluconolactonase